ncbi:MAG: PEPxxWA-CTERM sorting domain-containing protein, partial [Burkholderiaceae bacterium]
INTGNAADFYLNVHNAAFPGGAIRGQLQFVGSIAAVPEPATFAMLFTGLGVVGVLARRRRPQA